MEGFFGKMLCELVSNGQSTNTCGRKGKGNEKPNGKKRKRGKMDAKQLGLYTLLFWQKHSHCEFLSQGEEGLVVLFGTDD